MAVPQSIKQWVSKYPRTANFLKSRYDAFQELVSPSRLPNVISRKRFAHLAELSEIPMASLLISGGRSACTLKNGTKFFINDSPSMSSLLLYDGSYEMKETALMMSKVRGVVFDVGANFGWYSVHFSTKADMVYAFEPITYDELQANISLNGSQNVVATNKALGDRTRKTEFFVPKVFGGSASASEHNHYGAKVPVSMITLDEFAASQKIQRLDFIKADIEGGELQLLRGAVQTLRRFHPDLCLEILAEHTSRFGYEPDDIPSFLKGLGYSEETRSGGMVYFTAHVT
jgi:FkbM family methyltransferase